MEVDAETRGITAEPSGIVDRVKFWLLLEGGRTTVAGGITLVFVGAIWILLRTDVIHVGADSSAPTLFASGLTAGVVTLVTIALSVNQLILSRVFGSPNGLVDRLEGSRTFRHGVEDIAGVPASPNDPAAFLALIGRSIDERATSLERSIVESSWAAPEDTLESIRDVASYGESIDEELEEHDEIVGALDVVLGTNYARNIAGLTRIRKNHTESLSEDLQADLEAVAELLESVAVARQFFKTLLLQQDFARLSRYLVYSGLVALLATITLTLTFRTNAVTIPARILPEVVTAGFAFVVAPIALFTAFILRAATIAEKTVSVGPFIPPPQY